MKDGALRLATGPENTAQVARKLVSAGLDVSELTRAHRSLEEVFLELTPGLSAGTDSLRGAENRRTGNESCRSGAVR